jgi:hypothetical protein
LLWSLFLLRYKSRYESIGRAFGDPLRWPPPVPDLEPVEAQPFEFVGPMPEEEAADVPENEGGERSSGS